MNCNEGWIRYLDFGQGGLLQNKKVELPNLSLIAIFLPEGIGVNTYE